MRTVACFALASLVFAGCNYHQQQQQMKELSAKDSALLQQSQQKDSSISAYIHTLNDIQDNLNAIKSKEHLISVARENGATNKSASIVADIRDLDSLIVKNHQEISSLEGRLKASARQDKELRKLVDNFKTQLSEKDTEIASIEGKLAKSNDSIRLVMRSLNDSVSVIGRDTKAMSEMKTKMNTVHYAVGTYKELKDHGVIQREGSFIGIGGVPELKTGFNKGFFTTAQSTDVQTIPLYGKFDKLVTYHPSSSFRVTGGEKANSIVITDPETFWSTSKYLVVVITKPEAGSRNEAGMTPAPASSPEEQ